jgi:hypothetical protein
MSNQQLPLSERLKKGAAFLGQLWKNPENRCSAGWSLDPCTCQPAKKFCQARQLWIELALMEPEEHYFEETPFGLGIAMTASEWDSTGLKMKIQNPNPDVGLIAIGSTPECVTEMSYMGKMRDVPEALASTLRVLRAFPKSKVHGTVQPDPVAVPVMDTFEEVLANPDEAFE